MRKYIFLLVFLISICSTFSQNITNQVKKCVSFFFINHPKQGFIPWGTGFFVGIEAKEDSISFGYLVTSKHVFKDENQNPLDSIFVRINKKDGGSDTIIIRLYENKKPIFYTHKDQSVDLAVIPFFPDANIYDFLLIPAKIILTEDIYKSKNIREGDDAFFTGLFTPHFGKNKNLPIVRFGKVALISDEMVYWNNIPMDLYLIETTSFGGNSGSPLFFSLGPTRETSVITVGSEYFLGGIIQGYFGEFTRPGLISTSPKQIWPMENSGIAAVVPANKLYDILYSDELTLLRNLFLQNRNQNIR